jgi:hypothetical protein
LSVDEFPIEFTFLILNLVKLKSADLILSFFDLLLDILNVDFNSVVLEELFVLLHVVPLDVLSELVLDFLDVLLILSTTLFVRDFALFTLNLIFLNSLIPLSFFLCPLGLLFSFELLSLSLFILPLSFFLNSTLLLTINSVGNLGCFSVNAFPVDLFVAVNILGLFFDQVPFDVFDILPVLQVMPVDILNSILEVLLAGLNVLNFWLHIIAEVVRGVVEALDCFVEHSLNITVGGGSDCDKGADSSEFH